MAALQLLIGIFSALDTKSGQGRAEKWAGTHVCTYDSKSFKHLKQSQKSINQKYQQSKLHALDRLITLSYWKKILSEK